jgi:hypothetical protein
MPPLPLYPHSPHCLPSTGIPGVEIASLPPCGRNAARNDTSHMYCLIESFPPSTTQPSNHQTTKLSDYRLSDYSTIFTVKSVPSQVSESDQRKVKTRVVPEGRFSTGRSATYTSRPVARVGVSCIVAQPSALQCTVAFANSSRRRDFPAGMVWHLLLKRQETRRDSVFAWR